MKTDFSSLAARLRSPVLETTSRPVQTSPASCVVPMAKNQNLRLDPASATSSTPARSRLRGYLLLGSALLLCPCHLPIVLGLLAGGIGGGAFAAFLSHHMAPVIAFAAVYFVFALWLGQRLLSQAEPTRLPGARSVP